MTAQRTLTKPQQATRGSWQNTLESPGHQKSLPGLLEAEFAGQWGDSALSVVLQPSASPPIIAISSYDQKAQHLHPLPNAVLHLSVMMHMTPGEGWRGQLHALRQIVLFCRPGNDGAPGSAQQAQGSPFPETPRSVQPLSWEDLHMVQTRAMLELRVCSSTLPGNEHPTDIAPYTAIAALAGACSLHNQKWPLLPTKHQLLRPRRSCCCMRSLSMLSIQNK